MTLTRRRRRLVLDTRRMVSRKITPTRRDENVFSSRYLSDVRAIHVYVENAIRGPVEFCERVWIRVGCCGLPVPGRH